MGTITKIHESVFPLPIREDAVRRQIIALGHGWVAHPEHKPLDPSFEAYLARQRVRANPLPRLEHWK